MADNLSKEDRKKNMKAIKSVHTQLEDSVTKELWKRGVRFRKNVKGLVGKPDIAIKKYKVAVFLDSCFWHGCPVHGNKPKTNEDYWNNKLERNKARDAEVTKYYQQKGWNVLRIWEHDIKKNFDQTIDRIVNFLNEAMKHREVNDRK
jgi:DNA mismatch endonuclease (patch repair protein)